MSTTFWCVVPAAGRGARMGADCPKQYLPLAGKPLIAHTLERLAAHPRVAGLMVVLGENDAHWPGTATLHGKPVRTAIGGAERSDSVLAGLHALPPEVGDADFVLVHDAARPCVREADIARLVERAAQADGGLLGAPLRDTLKRAGEGGRSLATEPREQRWRAFTPQMFRRGELAAALHAVARDGRAVSDEAMAMELAGFRPLLVEGAEDNIKVTTAADLALAEFLLARTA
ncbi:2-C-methyl-D-erythritol 4-phosphate cytidylyltransferase [Rhodanobacter geophilus]|uniref:2-C-methyl-D-erythritol 4-phosphate cytidylyltransferase n=1 Tax=Rhodanobacter geophilus TaxID=3162488 RepID=A0ABV3QL44_9GAMM